MADPNSYANLEDVLQTKIHFALDANFNAQVLCGHVDITFDIVSASVSKVVLDSRDLTVSGVTLHPNHTPLKFSIGKSDGDHGAPLTIDLGEAIPKGSPLTLRIAYATSKDASGIQWLSPSQTAGKQKPYLFTQLQAIHARSMFPCQDSCAAKFTYTAEVSCPDDLVALMSAKRVGERDAPLGKKIYSFEQPVAIPAYLLALAIGDLVSRDIGPRSKVWAEPSVVDAAAEEFSDVTEKYLAAAESILGPYVWGTYDILLMPPSFPYGGMENPMLTFATPTLLSGDKANTNVIAHEIIHSWCGNLVTNKTWEDFWLNEGFTVFNERKILAKVHGEDFQHLKGTLGWFDLKDSCDQFGHDHDHTCLVWKLKGVSPDDAFSSVPYEKGFSFLWHLEQLVGGPSVFEPFQRKWIEKYKYSTATSEDFKALFEENFPDVKVDWDTWFHAPGMPKYENKFNDKLVRAYKDLAAKWIAASEEDILGDKFSEDDIKDFIPAQTLGFLEELIDAKKTFSAAALDKMISIYKFDQSKNVELRFRWIRLGLLSEYEKAVEPAVKLVLEQGRMKFTRPIYKALFNSKVGKAAALEAFKANRAIYHNICSAMVAKDLELA